MMKSSRCVWGLLAGGVFWSCGPSATTNEAVRPSAPATIDRETLFRIGQEFFVERTFDSAAVYYRKSLALDSTYGPPLGGLAQLHYDLAMQNPNRNDPVRMREFRASLGYYMRMETLGHTDGEMYDRLSELTYTLGEKELFLNYVKKNIGESPDDRQYFNLGLAYGQVGDYANVIKSQKEAIERFKFSRFIGSFYKQLGNAYLEVDRQQSAERTFSAGVEAVNERISAMVKSTSASASDADVERLKEERLFMLRSLRKIYRIHGQDDRLQEVERQLKGYGD